MSWWNRVSGEADDRKKPLRPASRSVYDSRPLPEPDPDDDGLEWHRIGELDVRTGAWTSLPDWGRWR